MKNGIRLQVFCIYKIKNPEKNMLRSALLFRIIFYAFISEKMSFLLSQKVQTVEASCPYIGKITCLITSANHNYSLVAYYRRCEISWFHISVACVRRAVNQFTNLSVSCISIFPAQSFVFRFEEPAFMY